MNLKFPWLNHPRSEQKDTMLTFSAFAVLAALIKFLTNGVSITIAGYTLNCGTVDAALIGAILTPTLGAYVIRKFKDSPDSTTTTTNGDTNE